MNDPLEQQTVIDFVLESEKHLDIAARMARAFPAAQRRIVTAVLDQLEAKIKGSLGAGWEIHNPREEFGSANYPGFMIQRASWGGFFVDLESQMREGSTTVGVWRDRNPSTAARDEALAEAFAKAGLSGERNRWWAWYKTLPSPYANWSSAETLAAMHFRREEVVGFYAGELRRVWEIAASVLGS